MDIRIDNLSHPQVQALLQLHFAEVHRQTAGESRRILGLSQLAQPDVTVFCAWEGSDLLGCAALKQLSDTHGEVKSMRTVAVHQRKGVARALVQYLIRISRSRGYSRLSLETGDHEAFASARKLYASMGFEPCGPFSGYDPDANSFFMTLNLAKDLGKQA